MSILVVDSDAASRRAQRNMLRRLGFRAIREAHDSGEATRLLRSCHAIRFVISTDADSIAPPPDVPLLVTPSEGWLARILRGRRTASPSDGVLPRPFAQEALRSAMDRAFQVRMRHRNHLLLLGIDSNLKDRIESLACSSSTAHHWRRVITASSPAEAARRISEISHRLGGILVDPTIAKKGDWLSPLRHSPGGNLPIAVCLQGNTPLAFGYRTSAHYFVPKLELDDCGTWLARLSKRLGDHWELARLWGRFRESRSRGDVWSMRHLADALVNRDPLAAGPARARGDVALNEGDREKAIRHFTRAISSNPFFPGPYCRLLQLPIDELEECGVDREELLVRAPQYCPRHPTLGLEGEM